MRPLADRRWRSYKPRYPNLEVLAFAIRWFSVGTCLHCKCPVVECPEALILVSVLFKLRAGSGISKENSHLQLPTTISFPASLHPQSTSMHSWPQWHLTSNYLLMTAFVCFQTSKQISRENFQSVCTRLSLRWPSMAQTHCPKLWKEFAQTDTDMISTHQQTAN